MPGHPTAKETWDKAIGTGQEFSCTGCAGFGRNYNRWLYRVRAARFRQSVRSLDLDPGSLGILDAGSGTGFYLGLWQQLGAGSIQAMDFSSSACDWLKRRHPGLPVYQADLTRPQGMLPGGPFDVISAFDVLFHIVDDGDYAQALENLAGWLKPGGLLMLSENFVHRERERRSDYHHSRSLAQIRSLLDASGLQLLERKPVFVLMNAPDDSNSTLLRAWWRLLSRVARRGEWLGWLSGALLYGPERLLSALLSEGPSTEIAVCRKIQGN